HIITVHSQKEVGLFTLLMLVSPAIISLMKARTFRNNLFFLIFSLNMRNIKNNTTTPTKANPAKMYRIKRFSPNDWAFPYTNPDKNSLSLSNSIINPTNMMINKLMRSMTLSATTVPIETAIGMPSVFLRTPQRLTSPIGYDQIGKITYHDCYKCSGKSGFVGHRFQYQIPTISPNEVAYDG